MASFYDTYSRRTAENDAVGTRDLQQASALMQLQQAVQAQRDQVEAKGIMQQGNGNLEAVLQGALKAGRTDIAAKLAPLIEAQRKAAAKPQGQPIGAGGLRLEDGTIVPPAARPADPNATPKAPPTRQRYDGANVVQEELQADGTWKQIGTGPRFAPEKPAAEKTYPIVHTADGIYERRPEGLVLLKDAKGVPLKANARERPITEYQGKNALYGSRATQADTALLALEDKISTVGLSTKQSLQSVPVVGGILGAGANVALSANQQRVEQAQRNFVNAVLRQESGAVISDQEFENARKQYFPQPGDKPAVIAQKRQNRKTAIEGFKRIAGPAWPDAPASPSEGGWSIKPVE
jgi:hypothetical protein